MTGRVLGDFAIGEPFQAGGYGIIYHATQKSLGREVVVKVMRWRGSRDDAATRRFLREAQLAARLDHPYAAHIYSFGAESDGVLWIAMELVRGTSLKAMLDSQGSLSLARFVPFLEKLAEVIHSAHEKGIIHRDIKPSNVMVMAARPPAAQVAGPRHRPGPPRIGRHGRLGCVSGNRDGPVRTSHLRRGRTTAGAVGPDSRRTW